MLVDKKAASQVSHYLTEYAETKQLYMKINYVNADHVHVLIDLPTSLSIEDLAQLLKGSSSHWINSNDIVRGKFAWGRGYAAFSVSESKISEVCGYIGNQAEHHRLRTFSEEFQEFAEKHGLRWREE